MTPSVVSIPKTSKKATFNYLSTVLLDAPLHADDREELAVIYAKTLSYIQHRTSVDISKILAQQNKVCNLSCTLIKSLAIYSTTSSIISSLLPGFIAQGLLSMGCFALTGTILFLPILVLIPYVIYKIDLQKDRQTYLLHIKTLILHTQYQIIKQIYFEENQCIMKTEADETLPLTFRKDRKYFNSTTIEAFCLFGTLFASGCVVLATFSACTLLACVFVFAISIALGLTHAHFHAKALRQAHSEKHEMARLKKSIYQYRHTLFESDQRNGHSICARLSTCG